MTTNAVSGQSMTLSVAGSAVAGSKSFTVSWSVATIDLTTRDDAFQFSGIAGRRGVKIDIAALYIYTNVAKKALMAAVNAGTGQPLSIIVSMPDGCTYTATAICTAFSIVGPDEGALTATASLQVTGSLTISVS